MLPNLIVALFTFDDGPFPAFAGGGTPDADGLICATSIVRPRINATSSIVARITATNPPGTC